MRKVATDMRKLAEEGLVMTGIFSVPAIALVSTLEFGSVRFLAFVPLVCAVALICLRYCQAEPFHFEKLLYSTPVLWGPILVVIAVGLLYGASNIVIAIEGERRSVPQKVHTLDKFEREIDDFWP